MPNVEQWLEQLDKLATNPANVQTLANQQLQKTLNNEVDIEDPTNPFVFLMESSAVNSAAAIRSNETYTRRLYGRMAQKPEELYTQMSDVDYLDRFAIPSKASFYLLFEMEELISEMAPVGVKGMKKVTIPKFTQITIGETDFTMQYPIDIVKMESGGIQVTYDNSNPSPVQTLASNIVPWDAVRLRDIGGTNEVTTFIRIKVEVEQFTISSQMAKVSYTTGCKYTYPYKDEFYYCRAYSIADDGSKTEIRTTHTDQVFDPNFPTLLLKDLDGSLSVELPQIYLTNESVGGEIQLDIYTTKGNLYMPLEQYPPNAYSIKWNGIDPDNSQFSTPLTVIATMTMYSDGKADGGRDGISFDALREDVLKNNYGPVDIPITPTQLTTELERMGYHTITNTDDVLERTIMATRGLPNDNAPNTSSAAAMTMQTLTTTIQELVKHDVVKDNGERVTIPPETLYEVNGGLLSIVTKPVLNQINALDVEARVRAINASNYFYSPFYYVLDSTENHFELRPYYLNKPKVDAVQFIESNDTLGIVVGTYSKQIIATDYGYRLQIQCQSSDTWKDIDDDKVFCQIAFIPDGEKQYAYMNGTLIGKEAIEGETKKERIFEFQLETNFDVDKDDGLIFTSFQMFDDPTRKHPINLNSDIEILWIGQDVDTYQTSSSNIDTIIGKSILPDHGIRGISHEQLEVTLGTALKDTLWHRSRSVLTEGEIERYSQDIPQYYLEDVYERDPQTNNIVLTKDGNDIKFNVIHEKGDPVLDIDDEPIILHHEGDPVLDSNGETIPLYASALNHHCDIFLIEGLYYFADNVNSQDYINKVVPKLVEWLESDIGSFNKRLIEETQLYFYPQITAGGINAIVENGRLVSIPAEQTFNVIFHLNDSAWENRALRGSLEDHTLKAISASLNGKIVSISDIQTRLRNSISDDVVSIDVTGLGTGSVDYNTITVSDEFNRLSVAKTAVVEPDGTIGIKDAVTVSFIHS